VGVGQKDQAQVREDRLGEIQHGIAGLVPCREYADLHLAQRVDGALEKADAGWWPPVIMAPGTSLGPDIDLLPRRVYIGGLEEDGNTDLFRRVAMMPSHVYLPGSQPSFGGSSMGLVRPVGEQGDCREEGQDVDRVVSFVQLRRGKRATAGRPVQSLQLQRNDAKSTKISVIPANS
jgi:hypothetical protein